MYTYAKHCQSYKKRCLSITSETLSLKTIIDELDFLNKAVIV